MFNDRFILKLFKVFSLIAVVLVAGRLVYLQVIRYDFYSKLVNAQSAVNIEFSKDRGKILDVNGKELAVNKKSASLYVFGRDVEDVEALIAELKSFGVPVKSTLKASLSKRDSFTWIARQMDVELARKVVASIDDVEFTLEDARAYPERELMAGVIGKTGVDNQGLSGIEYYEDRILEGTAVLLSIKRDSRGKLILFDDKVIQTTPDSFVKLTIDARLESLAEHIMKDDLDNFGAKNALALAIDIKSGEVLLSAAVTRDSTTHVISNKNFATTFLFEPGSIFKAVTFSYLMENSMFSANKVVDTSKRYTIYGHEIRDVSTYPSLTEENVFVKSSNIGTAMLTSKVDRNSFHSYLANGGFGAKLGLYGTAEEAGVLRAPDKWSGLSLASLSIGQELLVTPMQMVRFYGAIANDGVATTPRFIQSYESSGQVTVLESADMRIMKPETAAAMRGLMEKVVTDGTGGRASSSLIRIGGKTGTGQVIDTKTNTYSKSDYVASFAGFFPVEEPKVAMIVIFDSPKSSIYGGATGAQTFKRIAEQIAFFYNLGGDKTKVVQYAAN